MSNGRALCFCEGLQQDQKLERAQCERNRLFAELLLELRAFGCWQKHKCSCVYLSFDPSVKLQSSRQSLRFISAPRPAEGCELSGVIALLSPAKSSPLLQESTDPFTMFAYSYKETHNLVKLSLWFYGVSDLPRLFREQRSCLRLITSAWFVQHCPLKLSPGVNQTPRGARVRRQCCINIQYSNLPALASSRLTMDAPHLYYSVTFSLGKRHQGATNVHFVFENLRELCKCRTEPFSLQSKKVCIMESERLLKVSLGESLGFLVSYVCSCYPCGSFRELENSDV